MPRPRKRARIFKFDGRRVRLEDFKKKKSLTRRQILSVYKAHKKKNKILKRIGERRANIDECITESLVCLHEKEAQRVASSKRNKKGDLFLGDRKMLAESKGGQGSGPSSFGTETLSGVFYFTHIDTDTDEYRIYEFGVEQIKNIEVSKDCTIGRVWSDNKKRKKKVRPRVNLYKYVLENGCKPKFTGVLDNSFKAAKQTPARKGVA